MIGRMGAPLGKEAYPFWKCENDHACDSLRVRCVRCGQSRYCTYFDADSGEFCSSQDVRPYAQGYLCEAHSPQRENSWPAAY